jgi:single-strand DNA-binding protein
MSRDLNRCEFIGRLGNDPETRYTPNGSAVTNITIAVGDDYKDKNTGNKVEQTEWVRVSAFAKLAEVMAEYLKKGSKVYIAGKMKTRKWEKDGVTHYSTEIHASEMFMLDGKQDVAPSKRESPPQNKAPDDNFDDDIPF